MNKYMIYVGLSSSREVLEVAVTGEQKLIDEFTKDYIENADKECLLIQGNVETLILKREDISYIHIIKEGEKC